MTVEDPVVPTPPYRCSAASLAATEPLDGTASTVRAFLLLETPGPWGVHALREARMDPELRDRLVAVEGRGIRPLLVRRPGRRPRSAGAQLLLAHTPTSRLYGAELGDPRELLDLDLASPSSWGGAGLAELDGPLFLACTHGRHDACCAELGRPLAAALAAAAPDETWEVSHIGGDRFAPNVLVLPHGLYYGRLLPAEASAFVAAHREGRLDLEHLRGRSSYPFAVQAAEIHLRRHLADERVGPFPLLERRREGTVTTATFVVDGAAWQVQVESRTAPPARLTCRATNESAAPSHALAGITPSGGLSSAVSR